MEYIIRKATLEDAKDLSFVKKSVWETTYKNIYSYDKIQNYSYEENQKKFKNIISNKDIDTYVVVINNNIIGYMTCGVPIRKYSDYAQEIGLLYILKEYQGYGIGRRLFELAYNSIMQKGFNKFFISCNKYNLNAIGFYEKMGGKIVFVDEDEEDKSIPQVKFHYDIK